MDIKIELPIVTPATLEAVGDLYKLAAQELLDSQSMVAKVTKDMSTARKISTAQEPKIVALKEAAEEAADKSCIVTDEEEDIILDTAGNEWDAEIHTRTKSKNADGTWKYQRNKGPKAPEGLVLDPDDENQVTPNEPPVVEAPGGGPSFPTNLGEFVKWVADNEFDTPAVAKTLERMGVENGVAGLGTKPEALPELCDRLTNPEAYSE